MFRPELAKLLRERAYTLSELSRLLGVPERDIEDDLEHLARSLRRGDERLVVTPARCRKCGFAARRSGMHRPGRCPQCRSTWMEPPVMHLQHPATRPATPSDPPPRVAGRGVLEFRFTADCWVEVYGPAGERLLFDLARAGESRAVSGPGPWRVFVGYADGVRMSVGGRGIAIPAGRRSGATARFVVAADGSAQ